LKNIFKVSLPTNFGHLSKLMSLRLDRNKLTEIPESTYTMTTLNQLNLSDNPLKPIPGVKLWQHGKRMIVLISFILILLNTNSFPRFKVIQY
jgi:Leucine-rich repeat (LRR) protein